MAAVPPPSPRPTPAPRATSSTTEADHASSPTPTIRNVSNPQPHASSSSSGGVEHVASQQELGFGRPISHPTLSSPLMSADEMDTTPKGSLRVPVFESPSRPRPNRATTSVAYPSSRSASKQRPPLLQQMSASSVPQRKEDDDEEEVEDRGATLIRQRQAERRKKRKQKRQDEGPSTGVSDEPFTAQQARSMRSVSRNRGTSSTRRRETSDYFYESTDDSPMDMRASSIMSSTADEEDAASIIGDVVQEVIEQEAEEEDEASGDGDEGLTLRDRQDAINIEHPFGLPIWKPALYRKSRSVTRNAESALHAIPSAAAERHLLPGNILWVVVFGWWLTLACLFVALVVNAAEVFGGGRGGYGQTVRGLAWYIWWPFGKYVEGEGAPDGEEEEPNYGAVTQRHASESSARTVRPSPERQQVSFASTVRGDLRSIEENAPLIVKQNAFRRPRNRKARIIGRAFYWPLFALVICPTMLFVCMICWGLVVTIPMAKLTWALLKLLYFRPLEINFRSAPKIAVPTPHDSPGSGGGTSGDESGSTTLNESPGYRTTRARLKAGQVAPTAGPKSTVLICIYRAIGLQYYKYTIGGVNIMFINLLPLVFFTIIDGMLILPAVERAVERGQHIDPLLHLITSQALIFVLALASVIPLSYFIGMAVASISAQSSIGMGAVINATFGSIIEIILYAIALTQGKGRLVEGSIVGSILAGVLLMPGASMCSGALKRKEQKFNAKSAGVTSTMLIMAIIGTLTPTMFYQTYGTFELHCTGCPDDTTPATTSLTAFSGKEAWMCKSCYYDHPPPATDPFYQDQVETLMYACAGILLFSYLIGLWFSLRTHAAQIWQNPQQLMKAEEAVHPALRSTLIQRMTPQAVMQHVLPMHHDKDKSGTAASSKFNTSPRVGTSKLPDERCIPEGYTPFFESLNRENGSQVTPMRLPSTLTTEDFTRAVAVATVSALRHQRSIIGSGGHGKQRSDCVDAPPPPAAVEEHEEAGGHEAPEWTRGVSAGVLLACTLLYAIIAEILVDVVDVVLAGSGIDEKFLGLTLFALVPNTTEFMNAMSFALNGNIALSMEIGSAYALQVCLLQIPAMVAFSAFYDPGRLGDLVDTFTLIFPRWDVISIILAIFLLTYTYIEARSNYHRGSILVLAYVVLIMGFYYAPPRGQGDPIGGDGGIIMNSAEAGWRESLTMLWA